MNPIVYGAALADLKIIGIMVVVALGVGLGLGWLLF